MTLIPVDLRQLVTQRAKGKCEYCLIHQDFSIYRHEVDRISQFTLQTLQIEIPSPTAPPLLRGVGGDR